jgi:hypothetical protein
MWRLGLVGAPFDEWTLIGTDWDHAEAALSICASRLQERSHRADSSRGNSRVFGVGLTFGRYCLASRPLRRRVTAPTSVTAPTC